MGFKLTSAALKSVFAEVAKVRDTLNQYCLAPDKIPVSLDDLTHTAEELYGKAFTTKLVPLKSTLLRGLVEIYDKEATIYVDSELAHGLTRFVFVKELGHVMIAHADNYTDDPTKIIEFFVLDGPLPDNAEPAADFMSEELAKFAAVELLFPHSLRGAAKKRLEEGRDTLFTLAEWLEIPEAIVEYALSDHYTAFANKLWEECVVKIAAD